MIRLTLRLPEQLNDLLEKSARENERSKNAQILHILRLFLLKDKNIKFHGVDILVNTEKADMNTGITLPPLDSDIK